MADSITCAPTRNDAFDQAWGLDGLGNFATFDDDGSPQTRTTNDANEVTGITGGWIAPTYDGAGNMTSGNKPGDETVRRLSVGTRLRVGRWFRIRIGN